MTSDGLPSEVIRSVLEVEKPTVSDTHMNRQEQRELDVHLLVTWPRMETT
jgi:hypothetical protein